MTVRSLSICVALSALAGVAAPAGATAATTAPAPQPVPGALVPTAATGPRTAHCPPVLDGDGTVTFRWCRPGATSVSLQPETGVPLGNPTITLSRDAKTGVWSATTPLADGLWSYTYTVNGTAGLTDPSNPPWNAEGLQSQIFVPGRNDPSDPTERYGWISPNNPVPHGTLRQYDIRTANSTGPYANGHHPISVYLPPGYRSDCSVRYPTLYLLHGTFGNDVDWSTLGYAGIVEDNLLAAGRARAMVIVMPNFNNTAHATDPATGLPDTVFSEDGFREDLVNTYVPWTESHFCVTPGSRARAFAGLSQGADDALNVIENDATEFAYYGVWSPVCLDANCPAELSTAPGASTILGIHFGSGIDDALGSEADVAAEQADFNAAGVPNRRHMTPTDDDAPAAPATDANGQPDVKYLRQTTHTWDSWREQLRDALTTTFFKR